MIRGLKIVAILLMIWVLAAVSWLTVWDYPFNLEDGPQQATKFSEVILTRNVVSLGNTPQLIKEIVEVKIEKEDETESMRRIVLCTQPGELELVQRVVMAESGNQSYLGQMAVAQCIRDTCLRDGLSPKEVVTAPGQYTAPYEGKIPESIKEAVFAVFIRGESAVNGNLYYFYSLATGRASGWHESKDWVCTIGDHKFFN